jgi:hypothetical protein
MLQSWQKVLMTPNKMGTRWRPKPSPPTVATLGPVPKSFQKNPQICGKNWQIWEKRGGFKANLQVASLGGGPWRIFPKSADFLIILMYHRKRIYFSSTLSCNKKEEKNHQTSHFERVRPLQSPKQLWAHAPISIDQATWSACAHFNQPSNFDRMRPFQSTKQLWARAPISINQATLSARPLAHNTWPGTSFFYLPQHLTPPSAPTPRTNEPTHPSSPFEHGILWCILTASIWPSGDITDGHKEVKITMVDTSVHEST